MTPAIDMVNHSHKDNCTFHVFNAEMHSRQEKSYFDAEKYLCDFTLITEAD
jgi:hypothetical protein